MGTFADAFAGEAVKLPWIGGVDGEPCARVLGATQDAEMRKLKDAVLMKCPSLAPSDALPLLARDRMIRRAPTETDEAFAARLDRAQEIWDWGGVSTGLVNIFAPYGLTASTVQALRNCQVSGFWDGNEDWFSRVFLFVDSTSGPWAVDGTWEEDPGSGDLWVEDGDGDLATWDSTATVADLQYIRTEIRTFKSPDAYPVTIAVWLDTTQLPDGYWDSPGLWPEDDGDAGSEVWVEDEACAPLYWTLGHVWGEEAWLSPGSTDTWIEDDEAMTDLEENDEWIAFAGEET